MKSSSSVVFLRFNGRALSECTSQRVFRTGMRDREPVFLRFLPSVGDEDEFAASFFLKAGLLSVSVSLSITSLRLSRVFKFLSVRLSVARHNTYRPIVLLNLIIIVTHDDISS